MPHIRPFEVALIGIFALLAIIGIAYFASQKSGGGPEELVYGKSVTVWGMLDQGAVDAAFRAQQETDKQFSAVRYRQIDPRSFESELLNAIADGKSPDLIILPHTLLFTYRTKLTPLSEETVSERTFRESYVDGATIWRQGKSTYAIPFAVDPLMLFWNKDRFAGVGLAQPPKTWEVLMNEVTPKLTAYDARRVPERSAIGLGEYSNITHAKEILSMLFFQAGSNIVEERGDRVAITLLTGTQSGVPPAQAALGFYAQFAMPGSRAYTWSRSLPSDQDAFLAGTLGMYIGLGSEAASIGEKNPNLSFDIAPVPQGEGATTLRNYATFYGLAIPKASKNIPGAFRAAQVISAGTLNRALIESLGLAPAHRALYAPGVGGVNGEILRASALISRAWLDPAPDATDQIFKTMIEKSIVAREDMSSIIGDASYSLDSLFR